MPIRMVTTTEKFIDKCLLVHGARYDYSQSEFITSHTKTTVICGKHGPFLVSPNAHQGGSGCPVCGQELRIKANMKRAEKAGVTFVARAKAVWGDRINFKKVEYVTAKTLAIFICPEHGEWKARPDNILHGKGCPVCRHAYNPGNLRKSELAEKQFTAKANLVHNHRYDYSKVKYLTTHEKIEIGCPDHGTFWQSPANHLRDNGCPNCTVFGYRMSNSGWLYLQSVGSEFLKVGITNHAPDRRLKEIQRNSSFDHKLIKYWYFEDGRLPMRIETEVKRLFECGVVPKEDMEDGHSETMFIYELPKVIKTIDAILDKQLKS
jgi:hypothetical protein